jgi:hypothetical protein
VKTEAGRKLTRDEYVALVRQFATRETYPT